MKNVLITGATGGIGQALVEKYYKKDYKIFATGTNKEKLNLLEKKYPNNLKCIACDLSESNQIDNLLEQININSEKIDILINNAGLTKDNLFMRMNENDWNDVININLNSNFKLTKLIIKNMVKNKWGRIINITSDAAKIGNAGQANYVASKAAVEGLTRTIANEVATRGITVNCVSPGFINTDILNSIDESRLELMLKQIPMARTGTTKEVAEAVFFLSSEESSYITGQVLHINGGLTM